MEAYSAELERRLRRAGLPEARAGRIAEEVRAHAAEQSAALRADPEKADTAALAGFGPVRELGRSLADSAYEGPLTAAARRVEAALLVFAAVGPLVCVLLFLCGDTRFGTLAPGPRYWSDLWQGCVALWFGVCVLGVPLFAFLGRRPRPGRVLGGGLVSVAVGSLLYGLAVAPPMERTGMSVVRWHGAEGLAVLNTALETAGRERRLLEEGTRFWLSRSAPAAAEAPASLRAADGGYIVPRSFPHGRRPTVPEMTSAFVGLQGNAEWREVIRRQESPVPEFHRIVAATRPETVGSVEEARRRWRTLGLTWREWRRNDEADLRARRDAMAASLNSPATAGLAQVVRFAPQAATPLPVVVLLHWAGAAAGRAWVRRGWRRADRTGGEPAVAA